MRRLAAKEHDDWADMACRTEIKRSSDCLSIRASLDRVCFDMIEEVDDLTTCEKFKAEQRKEGI